MNCILKQLKGINPEKITSKEYVFLDLIRKECEKKMEMAKDRLIQEKVSDYFPELDTKVYVREGKEIPEVDMELLREILGPEIWNRISTITQTALSKVTSNTEAKGAFARATKRISKGKPYIVVAPLCKEDL